MFLLQITRCLNISHILVGQHLSGDFLVVWVLVHLLLVIVPLYIPWKGAGDTLKGIALGTIAK